MLNDFEILNKLGEGSFGTVYKARRKKDQQIYVMKQINISKMNQRMKNDALNEASILSKLDSQFIVRYYESFIDKNLLCIIMELCEGGDLHKYLKSQMGRPLQENLIWRILIQTSIGLAYLHQKNILHRDIKTMNIFLAKDSVRIGDLGVAKLMSDQNNFARTMVGTPYYLSPEMCEEKPYNEKSDIWALGCVIYELCTFKHPFEAQNQGALVLKIIRGRYEPIPSMYSPGLSSLIELCLQKDYRSRPDALTLLQQPSLLQAAQSLRLTLTLNQPHPNSKSVQSTPVVMKKELQTPVQVKAKAKPISTKELASREPLLQVKGKQEPIKETPVTVRKEVKQPQFKDWRDKVAELQKPTPQEGRIWGAGFQEQKQIEVLKLVDVQKVLGQQPMQEQKVTVTVTKVQSQPCKKPTVIAPPTVPIQIGTPKKAAEKKRIRKGAPQELARQAQDPQKKINEQLKLLKSKKPKQTTCSAEEVEEVANLPERIEKQIEEQVRRPTKEMIDLSQFMEQDDDIPTTEPEQITHDECQEEEDVIQFDEEEVQMDSDKKAYSEGEPEEEADATVDYDEYFPHEEDIQQFSQSSVSELILDNKKLDLNKKLLDAEKRRQELEQIMTIKHDECVRDMGQQQFAEIISFFRAKLNAEEELNDRDQEEIDEFVSQKVIKAKNPQIIYTIYKILHFEIEIQKCIENIKQYSDQLAS